LKIYIYIYLDLGSAVPLHCLFQSLHKESSGIGAALDCFEQALVISKP
jgi:hypothetical protein